MADQVTRDNVQPKAFGQGATAAATGALRGAVVVLRRARFTTSTAAAVALTTLAILWRYRVPEPIVVLAAAGLVIWLARGP